jgi:hypothetical protein
MKPGYEIKEWKPSYSHTMECKCVLTFNWEGTGIIGHMRSDINPLEEKYNGVSEPYIVAVFKPKTI